MTVPPAEIAAAQTAVRPLIGLQLDILRLPRAVLAAFEPSQIGTIVGTLVDACVPSLNQIFPKVSSLGLSKAPGVLGEREGYPDFEHTSGTRLELKMLYIDPVHVRMKLPPTPREPSARVTQKVTLKNVAPHTDLLMVLAYQLQPIPNAPELFAPTFIDVGLFPMIECVRARDHRLISSGGRWFGDYETPAVLSVRGQQKRDAGRRLDNAYGRKESEGKDYNEDTNFGKLKRIPLQPLQAFMKRHGCAFMTTGDYPVRWRL